MHDGMSWPDPRSKSRGVESQRNSSIFKSSISSAIFSGSWKMTADS